MSSAAVQTSADIHPGLATAGQAYDSGPYDIVSKIAAEAIPFGRYVTFTSEASCELPDSSNEITQNLGGVAMRDPTKISGDGYAAGEAVAVMVRGRVWVPTEEAVTYNDAVYARHTTGTATTIGAFRDDDDSAKAAIPVGARWFKGGTDLAVLELGIGGSAGVTGATGPTGPTGATGPTGPTA